MTLGSVSSKYAWVYLFADMALFLGIKALRRDFTYWLQVYGVLGFFISLICRIVAKVISDFTATIQLRHPYELGGLYFSMNSFFPLIGLILLLTFMEDGIFNDTTMMFLKEVTKILGGILVSMAILFFLLINKYYR